MVTNNGLEERFKGSPEPYPGGRGVESISKTDVDAFLDCVFGPLNQSVEECEYYLIVHKIIGGNCKRKKEKKYDRMTGCGKMNFDMKKLKSR